MREAVSKFYDKIVASFKHAEFCRLDEMFRLREEFMNTLAKNRPDVLQTWPIDVTQKKSQQTVRDAVLKGVEEMFEALSLLKAWKPHRTIQEDKDFDRDKFLEEYVDALNYFLSVPIMLGITADDLFQAYLKKDEIIHNRIKEGY